MEKLNRTLNRNNSNNRIFPQRKITFNNQNNYLIIIITNKATYEILYSNLIIKK